jgi:hypothetical protein
MKETIEKIIIPTLKEVNKGISRIVSVHTEEGNPMTKKQLSECISGVIESKMVKVANEYGIDIIAPKVDSEPDLIVDGLPLEIKTTSGTSWRGGEYSKRSSDYLMVVYNYVDGKFNWFVLHKYLKEEDWVSSSSGNYYATSISLDSMLDGSILVGDKKKKRVLWHPVLENVN